MNRAFGWWYAFDWSVHKRNFWDASSFYWKLKKTGKIRQAVLHACKSWWYAMARFSPRQTKLLKTARGVMNDLCEHGASCLSVICAEGHKCKNHNESNIFLSLHFTPFQWNPSKCQRMNLLVITEAIDELWLLIPCPNLFFQLKRGSIQMWFSLWHHITFRWHVKWHFQQNQQKIIQHFDQDLSKPMKIASAPRWRNWICSSTCQLN